MEEQKQKVINLYSAAQMAKLTAEEHKLIQTNAQELLDFIEDSYKEDKPAKKKK